MLGKTVQGPAHGRQAGEVAAWKLLKNSQDTLITQSGQVTQASAAAVLLDSLGRGLVAHLALPTMAAYPRHFGPHYDDI